MFRFLPATVKRRIRQRLRRMLYIVDRYHYVFIVTYGRSGSTLLMGILNSIPGYRVHGENHNVLFRLYQADRSITESYRMCAGNSKHLAPQSPWYGMLRARPGEFREDLINGFVKHVLRPGPGDRVIGFKEVRYTKGNVPDLPDFLEFMRRSFPGCKIIFNHRDLAAVAKSSWWALDENASKKLAIADARMREVPSDERHFHFFYDEIDDSLDHVRALFRFLGEEFDEATVREVLNTRHSPPPVKYAEQQAAGADLTGG